MIRQLPGARPFCDPCLGIQWRIAGAEADIERYARLLAAPRWQEGWLPDAAARQGLQLEVQLAATPAPPPASAIGIPEGLAAGDVAYCRGGSDAQWHHLQADGPGRWRLVRPAHSASLAWERPLLQLGALRSGGLPLHASVGRYRELGIVAIGDAHAGKTAVLLTLLRQGGDWVGDDECYCQQDLRTVCGRSSSIEVKQRYLRQLPQMAAQLSGNQRWRLRLSAAARRLAGAASRLPAAATVRRRLQRIAGGQSTARLCPPGRLTATTIDVALLVACGDQPRLQRLDPGAWALQASQVLWSEVRTLHETHRHLRAATGGGLTDGEAEDQQRLLDGVTRFASDKRCYQLVRPRELPLSELEAMLQPVWRGSDDRADR